MKVLKSLIYIVLITFFLNSCSEDYLDQPVLIDNVIANFYKTEADANLAVISAYDPLQWEIKEDVYFCEWNIGDICSDDAIKGGENAGDQPYTADIEKFDANSSNELVLMTWKYMYIAIVRCNLVTDNVIDIPVSEFADPATKDRIIAEAKFLRAYYYFRLIKVFGGVPLLTTVHSPYDDYVPRSTTEETWALIEKDLSEAIPHLPLKTDVLLTELGRVTQGAAKAFLVKAYVFQEKWSLAELLANEIILSGEYDLDLSYSNVFSLSAENGIGSIFEIQYMEEGTSDWPSTRGSLISKLQESRSGWGWGMNRPTADLIAEFETGDPRLDATVYSDASGYLGNFNHPKKYVLASADRPNHPTRGPLNIRVFRYADLLLLHAEAAYHNSNEIGARESVNKVRERARGGNSTILPYLTTTTTGNDLLLAIWHERRVELGMEGHRFFDLVRQKRASEVMQAFGETNFVKGIHELFPVPEAEILLSGGVLEQNFGY
ncbi:MAG: RagB/SusD family nutrient uptake outer membrane protein [Bacteroidales bacterium]|nr:RagB/SusD family nutrient uptake outer membrane protein [Bacteroidales bacterium]